MAQQSARRGRKNQGPPQGLEHALGDLDPARELPYRPAATYVRIRGRTDGSIRLRAKTNLKFCLDREGAFSNRTSCVNCFFLLLLPYQGHGSLRGRRLPPQHLVRSTGAAMSTTGSRAPHTAQRPPSQRACTLAPAGNSHPRQCVARVDLVEVWSGARGLLRPAERLTGLPDTVQDHGQLSRERDACLART